MVSPIMATTPLKQLSQQATSAASNHQYWQAADPFTELLAQTSPQTAAPDERRMRLGALRKRGRLLGLLGEQEATLAAYEQYYLEAGSGDGR